MEQISLCNMYRFTSEDRWTGRTHTVDTISVKYIASRIKKGREGGKGGKGR